MVESDIQQMAGQILRAQEDTVAKLAETNARLAELDEQTVKSERYGPDQKSISRRNTVALVAAFVALLAIVLSAGSFLYLRAQDARDARERRITGRGQLYAQCTENNLQNENIDTSLQTLTAGSIAAGRPAEGSSRGLDTLRQNLNLADCEVALGDLSGAERAAAKRSASLIPRNPLPPPSVPGYVPASTTTVPNPAS